MLCILLKETTMTFLFKMTVFTSINNHTFCRQNTLFYFKQAQVFNLKRRKKDLRNKVNGLA